MATHSRNTQALNKRVYIYNKSAYFVLYLNIRLDIFAVYEAAGAFLTIKKMELSYCYSKFLSVIWSKLKS